MHEKHGGGLGQSFETKEAAARQELDRIIHDFSEIKGMMQMDPELRGNVKRHWQPPDGLLIAIKPIYTTPRLVVAYLSHNNKRNDEVTSAKPLKVDELTFSINSEEQAILDCGPQVSHRGLKSDEFVLFSASVDDVLFDFVAS